MEPEMDIKSSLIEARHRHIGANVALNYSKSPLLIMEGRAQHLIDEHGRRYLDCVNNVCHVGHCHPAVAAAAAQQLTTLNTNSRYLHPHILTYAARLTATLPPPLSVIFWVNSGSEATDLALRLARAHTGKRGVITVGGAYHGHLTSVIDISPYKYAAEPGGTGRRPHVREAPIPDAFSGRYRGRVDDPAVGAAYAAEVAAAAADLSAAAEREVRRRAAIKTLLAAGTLKPQPPPPSADAVLAAAAGKPVTGAATPTPASSASAPAESPPGGSGSPPMSPVLGAAGAGAAPSASDDAVAALLASLDEYATDNDGLTAGCGAFICESVLSCGGQVVLPAGYLAGAYAAVRAAGGVCIADEVQVGFGRVGSHFWGFQLQGVVPDIVTMGKPMGNGFPIAAVVTTPAVAASFAATRLQYFNTYGGSPVAGAVANAVLDVIQGEGLQAHAAEVGAVLLDGFARLAGRHDCVGSARGVGLMVGLEILHPLTPEQKADAGCALRLPWTSAASAVVYAMKERGFLLSTDGMESNVIKLKPPMVFTSDDAAAVIAALDDVLTTLPALHVPGTVVGITTGDDPHTALADAAAAFYGRHPELAVRPLPGVAAGKTAPA